MGAELGRFMAELRRAVQAGSERGGGEAGLETTEWVWVCSASSLKTFLGLGALLDGLKWVPVPMLGQDWWVCSESPETLVEPRQCTLQVVLETSGTKVRTAHRISEGFHCLLTQKMCVLSGEGQEKLRQDLFSATSWKELQGTTK